MLGNRGYGNLASMAVKWWSLLQCCDRNLKCRERWVETTAPPQARPCSPDLLLRPNINLQAVQSGFFLLRIYCRYDSSLITIPPGFPLAPFVPCL